MTTKVKQYSLICKKARDYKAKADKYFKVISKEINKVYQLKDSARLEKHKRNMTMIYELLKNNLVSIQLQDNLKLQHINENESDLILRGAENILATIAHQNASLKAAVGMTKYIPDKN